MNLFVSDENCDGRAHTQSRQPTDVGSPGSFLPAGAEGGSVRGAVVLLPGLPVCDNVHLSVCPRDQQQGPTCGPGQV